MFCQPSRAHVRALVHALYVAPAVFSAPLYAQDAPDVQTQLTQIQASLSQIRTDYEKRIAVLETQVSQLQKENMQLSSQAKSTQAQVAQARTTKPVVTTAATAPSAAAQRVIKAESLEDKIAAVAPAPAAAAPNVFPNLGGNDRSIDLGAELFIDAKYSSQSQNPENPYIGVLPTGGEGIPRGFSIGETELALKGAVDNLFRAEARFVLEQVGNSTSLKTEEAYAETLGLPGGTKVKAGKYWSSVGYLNDKHPHEWDFVDLPLVYKQVFGGQLNETGAQLSWVVPTDNLLLKLGGEIAQGSNGYNANTGAYNSNYNQNKPRLGTLFAKTGGDIGEAHSWQGGISWVRATTGGGSAANPVSYTLSNENQLNFSGGNTTWIADLVYRWAPFGNPTAQNLKLQGEIFWNKQSGSMSSTSGCLDDAGASIGCTGNNFAQNQQGFYTQGIYQFIPKWRAGYRYDRVFNGTNSYGFSANPQVLSNSQLQNGWNPYRNTLMMDWANSEYSLIRLQLARDNSFGPGLDNNQIYLQYIMSLGAHGAHKY